MVGNTSSEERGIASKHRMGGVLVTGANGFIGSALCDALVMRQYSVLGVVRDLSRTTSLDCKITKMGDIGPKVNWSTALAGVDTVVHLAARAHLTREKKINPLTNFRVVNVEGTLNLALQAAKAGIRRFIFLSSIKVNGEQTQPGQLFTEQDEPAPIDPYGISKLEAEIGLKSIAHETGMELVVIRPPLVYGPGVKANVLSMMRWLEKGIPLPFGAIHNYRSLVALDNLVDFIITCIDHPAAANQILLVSDGKDVSTTELLRQMARALKVPARLLPIPQKLLEISFKLMRKEALAHRLCGSLRLDISKASNTLQWKPPLSLKEGLQRTATDYLLKRQFAASQER